MVINRHQRGRSRHDITSTRRSKPRVIIVSRSMIRASASETADDPDLPVRVVRLQEVISAAPTGRKLIQHSQLRGTAQCRLRTISSKVGCIELRPASRS